MKCKKVKCNNEAYKVELCKKHFYIRTMRYNGHLADIRQVAKDRVCLQCDKPFASLGNRRCDSCNELYNDFTANYSSAYIACE